MYILDQNIGSAEAETFLLPGGGIIPDADDQVGSGSAARPCFIGDLGQNLNKAEFAQFANLHGNYLDNVKLNLSQPNSSCHCEQSEAIPYLEIAELVPSVSEESRSEFASATPRNR